MSIWRIKVEVPAIMPVGELLKHIETRAGKIAEFEMSPDRLGARVCVDFDAHRRAVAFGDDLGKAVSCILWPVELVG